jgi:hypothetical protein
VPPPLRWIVDRCLAKEPEQRYESTRDLFRELRNLRDHYSEAHTSAIFAPIAPPKKRSRWRIPAVCAGCMLLAGLLGYLLRPAGQDIGNYRYTPISRDARSQVWSPDGKAFAYASTVNGTAQVFLRYLNSAVPIQLTHEKDWVFPKGWSSDGNHVIVAQFTGGKGPAQFDRSGGARLWISSLSGGAPVRLTNEDTDGGFEPGGSWSPDGGRFVYLQNQAGKVSLMLVKTSGTANPVVLKENVRYFLPDWSPVGDWITFRDDKGWNLISPDGKTSKFLGKIETRFLAFSKDRKLLYGIKWNEAEGGQDRFTLFSLDPVTLKQKLIKELNTDFWPDSPWSAGVRFSLAPDGKSFVYSTAPNRKDLWMLTGYRQRPKLMRIAMLIPASTLYVDANLHSWNGTRRTVESGAFVQMPIHQDLVNPQLAVAQILTRQRQ